MKLLAKTFISSDDHNFASFPTISPGLKPQRILTLRGATLSTEISATSWWQKFLTSQNFFRNFFLKSRFFEISTIDYSMYLFSSSMLLQIHFGKKNQTFDLRGSIFTCLFDIIPHIVCLRSYNANFYQYRIFQKNNLFQFNFTYVHFCMWNKKHTFLHVSK